MFLGVDGGGTKTAFVLLDSEGRLLSHHQEGTCYYIEVGVDGARQVIHDGIKAVFAKAGQDIHSLIFAFFGLPAFGEDSGMLDTLKSLPAQLLEPEHYRCDNDMVNGWAAAFGGNDGINIIAGTGSISFGMHNGQSARCGGWGELFSDEGSAYWIGRKGLMMFTRMSDGRSAKGPLYDVIKNGLAIQQDLDICSLVLSDWQGERGKIATVSTLVHEAALAGDACAISIFADAARELAQIVESNRKALNYQPDEIVNVAYSGGAFNANDFLLKPFEAALQEYSAQYVLQKPLYTPAIGAALYASELSGNKLSAEQLHQLRR